MQNLVGFSSYLYLLCVLIIDIKILPLIHEYLSHELLLIPPGFIVLLYGKNFLFHIGNSSERIVCFIFTMPVKRENCICI